MNEYQRFNSDEINNIANEISIIDYLDSQGIEPDKIVSGNAYYHCNNRSDTDASLAIEINKPNFFKCFSCSASGNILSYFIFEKDMNFPDACREVLKISGKTITNTIIPNSMKFFTKVKRDSITKNYDNSKRVYMSWNDYCKFDDTPAEEWIQEGILKETQRIFNVRIDTQRSRIVYPMWDANEPQRYITCKGRIRIKDYKLLQLPKYISYSPIGNIDFFCGWKENKEKILQSGKVFIFEGIKSVMKAYQNDIPSLSAETSSINKWQEKFLLKQNRINTIYICMDKDKTWDDVIAHIQLLPRFFNVYVVLDRWNLLNEKCSPIDCGIDKFYRLIDGAIRIK